MKSQIEVTPEIKRFADSINGIEKELIENIRNRIFQEIEFRDLDEKEKDIRWKRTAHEILKDGYVYNGKACSDIVILFLAIANARGFKTNFVKLKKDKKTHSVAEIKIGKDWYNFDVSKMGAKILEGKYLEGEWKVWKGEGPLGPKY